MIASAFVDVAMTLSAYEEHCVHLTAAERADAIARVARSHRHPEWESRLRAARAQLRTITLEQLWTRATMHGFELPFPEQQSVELLVDTIERVARLETLLAIEALCEAVPA